MNKIANTPLWKLGLRFSLVFFIVAVVIKTILSVLKEDFSVYVQTEEFRNYIIGLAIFSLLYGFLMASFQKRKHKK